MSTKSALVSAAVLGLGALALTACQSDGTGASAKGSAPAVSAPGPAVSVSASAGSAAGSGGTGGMTAAAPAASAGGKAPAATGHGGSGSTAGSRTGGGSGATSGTSGSPGGSGDATSDAYAFTHPCSTRQLTVHVTLRSGAPSQRVIAVRNTGPRSCGLSYYPLVSLDSAKASNGAHAVRPLIPSGLGGAPAYPLYAGRTAYAVIDLDPSGATSGTATGVDELNVLPDGDHMPNAATLNFPLGSGAHVLKPKLGLYRDTVADAVSSMRSADYQS